jgi:hypothetical protein
MDLIKNLLFCLSAGSYRHQVSADGGATVSPSNSATGQVRTKVLFGLSLQTSHWQPQQQQQQQQQQQF